MVTNTFTKVTSTYNRVVVTSMSNPHKFYYFGDDGSIPRINSDIGVWRIKNYKSK